MTARRRFDHHRGFSTGGLIAQRSLWRQLLELARKVAEAELAGSPDGPAASFLAGQFKRTAGNALPVEASTAAEQALIAFRAAFKGFDVSTGERRSRFAALLLAAARACDGLIDEAQLREADRWRGRPGGDN